MLQYLWNIAFPISYFILNKIVNCKTNNKPLISGILGCQVRTNILILGCWEKSCFYFFRKDINFSG